LLDDELSKETNFNTGKNKNGSIYNGIKFYSLMEFDPDVPANIPKIFQTHRYPDFEIIKNRLPNTKIILINLEEDDWLEVIGNTVHKNGIPRLIHRDNGGQLTAHERNYLLWFKDIYLEVLGVDLDFPFKYDIKETEKIVRFIHNLWKTSKIENISLPSFINPVVDFEKYTNLTVINYKELFAKTNTGSYIALDKLEKLSSKVANEQTIRNYEKYVCGRNNLLSNKMPWLLKNENANN